MFSDSYPDKFNKGNENTLYRTWGFWNLTRDESSFWLILIWSVTFPPFSQAKMMLFLICFEFFFFRFFLWSSPLLPLVIVILYFAMPFAEIRFIVMSNIQCYFFEEITRLYMYFPSCRSQHSLTTVQFYHQKIWTPRHTWTHFHEL